MDNAIKIHVATEQDLDTLVVLNSEVQIFHANAVPQRFKDVDREDINLEF